MTIAELAQALNGIATTTHIEFDGNKLPSPPFIAYIERPPDVFAADDRVLSENPVIRIEIYCARTDYDTVPAVKAMLTAAGIVYDVTEVSWIQQTRTLMTALEVVIY